MIVARIEIDHDPIALWEAVAAAESGADGRGLASEAADSYVVEPLVVRNLHTRPFGCRLHVVRLDLDEVADTLRLLPHRVVQAAVDAWGGISDPKSPNLLPGPFGDIRLRNP